MKWLRFLFATAVFALVSCSSPFAPKYPDPDEEQEENPSDPDQKNGFLLTPQGDVTFWV